jgi:hypothetical protein
MLSLKRTMKEWFDLGEYSRPTGSTAPLFQLPTELLLEIVEADYNNLASLRLVNRELCMIVTPILFSFIKITSRRQLNGFTALLKTNPKYGLYCRDLVMGSDFQLVRWGDDISPWQDLDLNKMTAVLQKLTHITTLAVKTMEETVHLHNLPSTLASDYFAVFQHNVRWDMIQSLEIDVGFDPEWTCLIPQISSKSIRKLVLRLPSSRPPRYTRWMNRRVDDHRGELLMPSMLEPIKKVSSWTGVIELLQNPIS